MRNFVCILAGGSGSRLWPLSTKSTPKQILKLFSDKTLIRETFDRLLQKFSEEEIFVSLNINDLDAFKKELPELPQSHFITEPCKMDTTAAIGLIAATIKNEQRDANVYIVQCDHYIPNPEELFHIQDTAFATLEKHPDKILAIGTNPNYAETTFGYIEMGEPVDRVNNEIIFTLASFKEKPDKETAESYTKSWKYLWNLGNYAFNASNLLEEYKKLVPNTYTALMEYLKTNDLNEKEEVFKKCDKISFDYGISEKTDKILVIPGNLTWIDIGTWKAIKYITKNGRNDSLLAQYDSEGNLIISNKKVALLGVKDLAVIESDKVILITKLSKSHELKKIVEQLPEEYL